MPDVSEHDGEEEGEGDDGEQSGVDLLVRANTVGVDDGLEAFGKLVRAVERRGILGRSKLVKNARDAGSNVLLSSNCQEADKTCSRKRGAHGSLPQGTLDGGDVPRRDPAFSDERLAPLVPLPQVEGGVDNLLTAHDGPPGRDALGDLDKLGAAGLVRVEENRVEVLDAGSDFAELVLALVGVRVDREERSSHG